MSTSATRPRLRQEQRSAQTRERLLDATIECLTRYGYAGTTTPRVAELAGVTRGAQVHHFGSKDDLMLAALQHLAAKRVASVLPGPGEGLTTDDDVAGTVLDLIWEIHSGPVFIPIVELWVAGRTDAELGREVARFEGIALATLLNAMADLVPATLHQPLHDFVFTAMDTLRGILVSAFVDADPTRARRRWDRACVSLRRMMDPSIREWSMANR